MEKHVRIAENLLGRQLSQDDGLSEDMIFQAETRLKVRLPEVLKSFYLKLGNNPLFMDAFEHIYPVNELQVEDGMIMFMSENQEVVLWGFKEDELHTDDPNVYQINPNNTSEIYCEEKSLSDFLEIMLYYQAAQGGYAYCGWLYEYEDALPMIERDWNKVVEHNGLHIWWQKGKIIFKLDESEDFDFLTASAQTRELLEEIVQDYDFEPDEAI